MITLQEMEKRSSTFCIIPFTHIVTKTNGEFKLCCRSLPLYNVKEKGLFEVWNSEKYKRIRKQLMNGERPDECIGCWYLEDSNVRSMRDRENTLKCIYNDYLKVLDNLNDDYSMKSDPLSIELKLNNICNLKCRMCHPVDSTKWAKDWPLISELQRHNEWTYENVEKYNLVEKPYLCEWKNHPSFFEDIKRLAKGLDTVWFAGGEPLVDPMHYRILDMLADENKEIRLQYATNLTKISFRKKHIMDYWRKFRGVYAGVSFDGLKDVFEYIRTNGNFDEVIQNIKEIREIAEQENLDVELFAACTFQACNIFDLPEMFDFLLENDIWVHSHRVTYPKFLSCQVLPKDLKKVASERIEAYYEKIKQRTDLKLEIRKNVLRHTNDNLNFLNGHDLSSFWPDFIEYNKIIDEATNSKQLIEVRPEFGGYI